MEIISNVKNGLSYYLKADASAWKYRLTLETAGETDYIHLEMDCEQAENPPETELFWNIPSNDIAGIWHPETSTSRSVIKEYFMPPCVSSSNTSAPVWCMFSQSQYNRFTFALSDAENVISFYNQLDETDFSFNCGIRLFTVPQGRFAHYELTLRVDKRDIPYYRSLSEVAVWWEEKYPPLSVPEKCFQPLYSTWYSFHQSVIAADVEKQCDLSAPLGCETVIVDDGWQTPEIDVGYTDCGDWIISEEKFPDMAAHVGRVHEKGMKYLLWFPIPFIAAKSKAYASFHDKVLPYRKHVGGTCILDPRYPEVREYLIGKSIHFVRDWQLDGLKLDFMDQFRQPIEELPDTGRDFDSVPLALDFMLHTLVSELKAVNPDIMLEFRQMYLGPVMRRFGNIFRAGDCADDILLNRVRTTDIRLIAGNSSVHSDMISWHRDESPEIAARQLLNVIFSVLQISVRIDEITEDQKKMLTFWLAFSKKHSEVLFKGEFRPQYPQLLYPVISSEKNGCNITACYLPMVLNLTDSNAKEIYIINASDADRVVMELGWGRPKSCRKTVYDCLGTPIEQGVMETQGITDVKVPVSGLLHLSFE